MSFQFVCDHCKKKFELETPEAKECPFCFWTSSVKREDELASEKKVIPISPKGTASKPGGKVTSGNFSRNLKYLFRALIFLAVFAAIGFLAYKAYKIYESSSSRGREISFSKSQNKSKQSPKAEAAPGIASLSAQEKEALYREVVIPADRAPDAGEQEILNRVVPFQTGQTEKLPSAAWTLEQYQKMIADQEAFYKMPFARSYKKKLEELFKSKYLAAADAFAKGDILMARNLWVESLVFPLYSTDLKKHRAVALTMLRPFINDTLSKVSAMNQSLVESGKRAKEQSLSVEYQKLSGLIAQKKWQEALAVAGPMIQEIQGLRKNANPQEVPPPYPASFGMIDVDLQRPLMDLMTPTPSSTADLQPLQQDLVEKKEALEMFTEAYTKNAMEVYRSALELIRAEKWEEAIESFAAIQGPPALQQDAIQKVAILGKMVKSST
jgi:hypothetical protein